MVSPPDMFGARPSLTYGTGGFALAYQNTTGARDSTVVRLDAAGTVLSSVDLNGGIAITATPKVIVDNAGYSVTWIDFRGSSADLYGQALDSAGAKMGPQVP